MVYFSIVLTDACFNFDGDKDVVEYMSLMFILMNLGLGMIFAGTAYIARRFPPKDINHLYGYRTRRSMKYRASWDFSQSLSNEIFKKVGYAHFTISILGFVIEFDQLIGLLVTMLVMMFLVFGGIWYIEQQLKQRFPDKI